MPAPIAEAPLADVPAVPAVLPEPLVVPLPEAVVPEPLVADPEVPVPLVVLEPELAAALPIRALVSMKPPAPLADAAPVALVPDPLVVPLVVPLVEPEPDVPVMLPDPLALARHPTTVTVFPLCEALDGVVPDEVCAARPAALAIATAPMLANSRVMVLSP